MRMQLPVTAVPFSPIRHPSRSSGNGFGTSSCNCRAHTSSSTQFRFERNENISYVYVQEESRREQRKKSHSSCILKCCSRIHPSIVVCAYVCRNALKRMSNFPSSHPNRSERHSQLFRAGRHGIGSAGGGSNAGDAKECQRKLAYTVEDRQKSLQAYGFLKRQDETKLQSSLTTSDGRIMQLDEKFETTSRPFTEVRPHTSFLFIRSDGHFETRPKAAVSVP